MIIPTQQQMSILQLAQAMFNAAPGSVYLNEGDSILTSGTQLSSLAQALAGSMAFFGRDYSSTLTPTQFSEALAYDLVGDSVSTENKSLLINYIINKIATGSTKDGIIQELIQALYSVPTTNPDWGVASANHIKNSVTKIVENLVENTVLPQNKDLVIDYISQEIIAGKSFGTMIGWSISALDNINHDDPIWGDAAALFDNRIEVSKYYSIEKGGAVTDLAMLQTILSGVTADVATVAAAKTAIDILIDGHVLDGKVVDGYIANATVFADENGDGIWNEGEAKTTTDEKGNFFLEGAKGAIIATGGTDISSGKSFVGILKAPEGSTVINPLTTLQQAFIANGYTADEAKSAVGKALGFDVSNIDLITFDPLAVAFDTSASDEDRMLAINIQAEATKLINFLIVSSKALIGAAGGIDNLSVNQAVDALLESMINAIENNPEGEADFTDPDFIAEIINGSIVAANDPDLTAVAEKIEDIQDDLATILADSAKNIDEALSGDDIFAILAQFSQISSFAQDSMAETIESAAEDGDLGNLIDDFTGDAADEAWASETILDLDPDSEEDAEAIDDANDHIADDSDTTAPILISSDPSDDEINVAVNSNIRLNFSESVMAGSGNIIISDGTDTRTIAIDDTSQITISGKTVRINPISNLNSDTTYYVKITSGAITDTSGNSFAGIKNTTKLNFSTTDTIAPVFDPLGSNPQDNGTIEVNETITLYFNEAIDSTSSDLSKVYLKDVATDTLVDATISVSKDGGLSIDPTGNLSPDTEYYVTWDADALADESGNYVAAVTDETTFNFTATDTTAPVFDPLGSSPNDDGTLYIDDSITLYFDEYLDGTLSDTSKVYLKDIATDTLVDATISVSNSKYGGGLSIDPTANLSADTEYYVTWDADALADNSGNYVTAVADETTFNFTAIADTTAPVFDPLGSSPNDDGTFLLDQTITLYFNEAIDAALSDLSKVYLKDVATDTLVDATISVSKSGSLSIDPTSNLLADTEYYVTWDADALADDWGNYVTAVADETTFNFTAIADTTAPVFDPLGSSPNDDGTFLLDQTITLYFNEAIDAALSDLSKVYLKDVATDTLVDATISVSNSKGGGGLSIDPTANLSADTEYYVTWDADALADDWGNYVTAVTDETTFNFTAIADTTAPVFDLLNSYPQDNGTIQVNETITVGFNEAIDAASSDLTKVYLKDVATDTLVDATISISKTPNLLSIDPIGNLSPDTEYYVTWDADALADESGNYVAAVTDETTFNFTATDTTAPANDGSGLLTQNDDGSGGTADAGDDLVLTFTEPIGNKTIVESFFNTDDIYGATGTRATVLWSSNDTILTVTLGTGELYDAGTPITLVGVEDLVGNAADITFSFV